MQPCGGLNWIKGRARHIPTQTDTVVRFAPEHVVLFLCLCYLVNKGATKAATPHCVPKGIVRARHIRTRTDTVVRFVQEHVVLFLYLCDFVNKDQPQWLLRLTAFLNYRYLSFL